MKEECVFPHNNWYIEVTDNNRKIINDWKIKQVYNNNLFKNTDYRYVYCDGWVGELGLGWGFGYKLITTEEFIMFVIGTKEDSQIFPPENHDCLIQILNNLNIK